MFNNKFLVVDVETSGLDETIHSVLSIGACLLDTELNIINQQYWLVKPKNPYYYTEEALKINGFKKNEDFSRHEPISAVVQKFHSQFAQGSVIPIFAGWNPHFDARFTQDLYRITGLQWPFSYRYFDIQTLACFSSRGDKVTLHSELKKYNKKVSHNALQDCIDEAFLLNIYREELLN